MIFYCDLNIKQTNFCTRCSKHNNNFYRSQVES